MLQEINHLNLDQKIGLKKKEDHEEHIMPIVTLKLKFQWEGHFKAIITVLNTTAAAAPVSNTLKVIFKNCAPFTKCINKINDIQIDDAPDLDTVMPMYNLI